MLACESKAKVFFEEELGCSTQLDRHFSLGWAGLGRGTVAEALGRRLSRVAFESRQELW